MAEPNSPPIRVKVADLARPRFKADPYPFYARLRREAPVCPTRLLGQPTWLVSRYPDVFAMLKDERFVKDWWPRTKWLHRLSSTTRHMLNQDGPDHIRLRTLVHKAFTPQFVEKLRGRIQTQCDQLLDKMEANAGSKRATSSPRQMDLMNGYALPLPLNVISDLLGIPASDRLRLHRLSRSSLSAANALGVIRSIPDQHLLVRHLRKLIAARRREPRDDLITALVQAEEAGDKLSEQELVSTITLLLIAGYETTVNLIGNGALALMQHARQRELFQGEVALGESTIEELLRFTSPLDLASQRFAREDLTIDSVRITQGDIVIAVIGSANHDESQFPNPETFDIRRQPNKHLSFGQGSHFCLGAPLARLEGQLALTTLFNRFPNLHPAVSNESLRWRKSLIVRGLDELPVAA